MDEKFTLFLDFFLNLKSPVLGKVSHFYGLMPNIEFIILNLKHIISPGTFREEAIKCILPTAERHTVVAVTADVIKRCAVKGELRLGISGSSASYFSPT